MPVPGRGRAARARGLPGGPAEDRKRHSAEGSCPRQEARKLLVVTLNNRDGKVERGHASIPPGNLALEQMGKTGAYEAVFSNDMNMFSPENLKQFDAICFNNTVGC